MRSMQGSLAPLPFRYRSGKLLLDVGFILPPKATLTDGTLPGAPNDERPIELPLRMPGMHLQF
jgi:hypothetical protein